MHHKIKICITKWHFSSRKKNPTRHDVSSVNNPDVFLVTILPQKKSATEKKTLLLQCFVKLFANVHNLGAARKEEKRSKFENLPPVHEAECKFQSQHTMESVSASEGFPSTGQALLLPAPDVVPTMQTSE